MRNIMTIPTALLLLAAPALAEGDAEKGEKEFKKCRNCHMIVSPDGEEIYKGASSGPNLWGVLGSQAGTVEGYNYSAGLVAAGEAGLIWDEEQMIAFMADPKKYLTDRLGETTKSKSQSSCFPSG